MPQLPLLPTTWEGKRGEFILANMGTNPVVKAGSDPIACSAKKHVPRHTKPSQHQEDTENLRGLSHQNPAGPASKALNNAPTGPVSIQNSHPHSV